MKDAKRFLELLTSTIPPGADQRHSIALEDGTLEVCLMLGDVYLPVSLEPGDFETPIEDLVEQIVLIWEGHSI